MPSETTTKARPIVFSAENVRAIVSGRKTQTRRVLSPQPTGAVARFALLGRDVKRSASWFGARDANGTPVMAFKLGRDGLIDDVTCPYGEAGSTLWVREKWCPIGPSRPAGYWTDPKWKDRHFFYAADNDLPTWGGPWRSPRFMPREAARLSLHVLSVRIERLHDISEADARAEGFPVDHLGEPYEPPPPSRDTWQGYGRASFCLTWNEINGKRAPWDSNPFVWVVTFERIEAERAP